MSFEQNYESIVLHSPNFSKPTNHLLIYFLTGNPGLIDYYQEYLNAVLSQHGNITGRAKDTTIHIYGCSLAGFETSGKATNARFVAEHGPGPWDVDQEIAYVDGAIDDALEDLRAYLKGQGQDVGKEARVVLIGHSLGTYMTLEILRRRKARQAQGKIIGAILLCPTIMNLAGSSSGRKVALIGSLRFTAVSLASLARVLSWLLSLTAMLGLVQRVTGQPPDAAFVTTSFLQSPNGVRQALTLARHELVDISADKWDDEIWGVVAPASGTKTKLFLYFAEVDHWIADETRDQIIAARAYSGKVDEEDRPVMEIDTNEVPHDFCIRHSQIVADKTVGYLRRIIDENWQ
ncbi:hypothetical protein BDZ85DRAFT_65056 [Elsinoe ampelina]|uniref:Alpha/Beta hydrolase protein n=1 Tax=Elsinoe ampelina TaxID=302913 RepID=A0A6A6FZ94_9PEZI|nr:hypothetical protein BDZ85DRAFT_65056 [Elsinoe ampelina]